MLPAGWLHGEGLSWSCGLALLMGYEEKHLFCREHSIKDTTLFVISPQRGEEAVGWVWAVHYSAAGSKCYH